MKNWNVIKKWLLILFVTANVGYFALSIWMRTAKGAPATMPNAAITFEDRKIVGAGIPELTGGAEKKIILRMLRNDCHECVDSIFNNTKRLAAKFGRQNVMVLLDTSYSDMQYLKMKRIYQFELDVFRVGQQLTDLDRQGNSYYFMTDRLRKDTAYNTYPILSKVYAGHNADYKSWIAGWNK